MIASVIALPGVISQRRRKRARWVSPDRGIRSSGAVTVASSTGLVAQPPFAASLGAPLGAPLDVTQSSQQS